jgi:hypothetical protein
VGFKIKTAFVACNTNYTITQSANAMQAWQGTWTT